MTSPEDTLDCALTLAALIVQAHPGRIEAIVGLIGTARLMTRELDDSVERLVVAHSLLKFSDELSADSDPAMRRKRRAARRARYLYLHDEDCRLLLH